MDKAENTDSSKYSRQIKNSKDFKKEKDRLEYEAKKKIALPTPRPIDQDLNLREIGRLRIQILYCPSFETCLMWDIREKHEQGRQTYEVYESNLENLTTIMPGYKRLPIEHKTVLNLIDVMNSSTIKLQLDSTSHHGLDGTLYGLNIYNDLHREIRVRWGSEPPNELIALATALNLTIDLFKKIDGKINID